MPESPYLIASWIIHKLMATGMERLASIDRIQDYFVSNDNLQRSAASDKFAP